MQQQCSQVLMQTGLCQSRLVAADSSRLRATPADGAAAAPHAPRAEHAGRDRMSEWGACVCWGTGGVLFLSHLKKIC